MTPSRLTLPRPASLRRNTLVAVLGVALLASCTPALSQSHFGFLAQDGDQSDIDVAWNAVAQSATRTYGELAMVNFAMRQVNFVVEFTHSELAFEPQVLKVPRVPCIADSPLLTIFAAVAGNILGRNEMDAGDKAAVLLRPLCAPGK